MAQTSERRVAVFDDRVLGQLDVEQRGVEADVAQRVLYEDFDAALTKLNR